MKNKTSENEYRKMKNHFDERKSQSISHSFSVMLMIYFGFRLHA